MKRQVIGIEIQRRDSPAEEPGFLTLERLTCRNLYDDGGVSRPYTSQIVHRLGYDSVAIIPYWIERQPRRLQIFVARGIRPAPFLRQSLHVPFEEPGSGLYTFEAIAGSLEPGDRGEEGIDRRAAIELEEEAGFTVLPEDIERLGAGFLPSHGQSTEKIHLRAVRVDPAARRHPLGDGSVGEEDSLICVFEAAEMLSLCRRGEAQDPKIEIGIARLCRRVGFIPELSVWRDELPEDLLERAEEADEV